MKKKVLVAGRGPGGLYAAYMEAQRGHQVIFCEKEAELGDILKSEHALSFNMRFWCKGYYVDPVGRNKTAIAEYIRNHLQEDIATDQISFKEYIDPFTGSKSN